MTNTGTTATKSLTIGQVVRTGDQDSTVTAITQDRRGIYTVTLTKVNGSPFDIQHPATHRTTADKKWFAAGTVITAAMA